MNDVYLASFAVKCYKVTCVNELLRMFPHYVSESFLLLSQTCAYRSTEMKSHANEINKSNRMEVNTYL